MKLWGEIKDYIKQIGIEIKFRFKANALGILLILLLIFSFILPILANNYQKNHVRVKKENTNWVTYQGTTVSGNNYFYNKIYGLIDGNKLIEENADDELDDLVLEANDELLGYYVELSQLIDTDIDYRLQIYNKVISHMMDRFILEHLYMAADDLIYVMDYSHYVFREYDTIKVTYYELTEEQIAHRLGEVNREIEYLNEVIRSDNYCEYIDYEISLLEKTIADNEEHIKDFEKKIIINPAKEREYGYSIEELKRDNTNIKEVDIPILEYRKENMVYIGEDDWRNRALDYKAAALMDINRTGELISKEEFCEDLRMKIRYNDYSEYERKFNSRIEDYTERVIVADKSLNFNQPDMRFVSSGTRNRVNDYLVFNVVITFLLTAMAGGILSKDFKGGTIRLLMIRPKNRVKLAMSRFIALLLIMSLFYLLCVFVNAIGNGLAFGFSDYLNPNYTLKSSDMGISFIDYLVPKLFICLMSFMFFASMAYFLSITTKNTAVSVAVPMIFFAASTLLIEFLGYHVEYNWISYAPIAYVNVTIFDRENLEIALSIGKGVLSLAIPSLIFIILGNIIFAKRDVKD